MTALFSKPKQYTPAPPPPLPAPPTIDDAAQREDLSRKFRSRIGGKATTFAGGKLGTNAPTVGTKALLGQ